MIQVVQDDLLVELIYSTRKVIIPIKWYNTFNENLFVEYGQGKRVKMSIEELTFGDFNLIWYKHAPKYNDIFQRRLDVEHLLSVCKWVSETIIR
jgi:hypothetical protein